MTTSTRDRLDNPIRPTPAPEPLARRAGRLFHAGLFAMVCMAGCDANLVVGVLKRPPHDGSGGAGGGPATASGGKGGAVASSGGASMPAPNPNGGVGGRTRLADSGCGPAPFPVGDSTMTCGSTSGVAYSPDGNYLAAGLRIASPNVFVWSLPSWSTPNPSLRTLEGISDTTYAVAFSPDSRLLATAGQGTSPTPTSPIVKIWDMTTGTLVRSIPVTCGFYADAVAFSLDGTLLATAGYTGPVELWRVADGTRVTSIPYPTSVHNLHFSPDGTQLLVAGVDHRATAWTVPEGALSFTLDGIADEMADAAFSPSGKLIATTGTGNAVKIWDATTHTLSQTLTGHEAYVSHVLWVGDDVLFSDDWSGVVLRWVKTPSGFAWSQLGWDLGAQALGMALAPDKSRIAIGNSKGITFITP